MRRRIPQVLRILLPVLSLSALPSCDESVPEPEKAARAFVEAYYVRADLKAAVRLAAGLAKDKIKRQAGLRKSRGDGGSGRKTSPGLGNRRNVEFEILEVRDREDGRKVYRFGLSISNPPVQLRLQSLVTVGKRAEGGGGRSGWAVVNFLEIDNPPTRGSGRTLRKAAPG